MTGQPPVPADKRRPPARRRPQVDLLLEVVALPAEPVPPVLGLEHQRTVGELTPTRRPISTLLKPSAASNTMRPRCTNPAGIEDDRVHPDNVSASPARNTNGSARDIRHSLKP